MNHPNHNRLSHIARMILCASLAAACGCSRKDAAEPDHDHADTAAAAPTNRVDITDAVRRNLGVTFAKVETRNVARTLRVPGRFEPMPTARREYRAPLAGRVELLVAQYQRVEPGTPLYRIDAPAWRAIAEEIIATEAKVASMGPLREAHRVHEKSLADKVELWTVRLKQLDELRAAMPHAWILVPGFGRQGGRASDVRGAFHADGLGALVVSARDVIYAHSRPEMNSGLAAGQWQTAVERACLDMIDRLAADTPAANLK